MHITLPGRWRRRSLVDLVRGNIAGPGGEGDLTEVVAVAILRDELEQAEAILAALDPAEDHVQATIRVVDP